MENQNQDPVYRKLRLAALFVACSTEQWSADLAEQSGFGFHNFNLANSPLAEDSSASLMVNGQQAHTVSRPRTPDIVGSFM